MSSCGQVIAQFKYSYEYEGKTISFKKGEEFQLLNKANKDWWQVRRWLEDGTCEMLYVPANYMKEKESEIDSSSSHVYQNMSDLQNEYKKTKEQMEQKPPTSAASVPTVQPRKKPSIGRTKSHSLDRTLEGAKEPANGHIASNKPHPSLSNNSEPEYAIPHSPVIDKKKSSNNVPLPTTGTTSSSGPISRDWQPGYALPGAKKRTQSSGYILEESSLDIAPRNSVPTILESDEKHTQHLQSLLFKQLSNTLGATPEQPVVSPTTTTSSNKLAPAPKPKPKPRPRSHCYNDDDPLSDSVSTFKSPEKIKEERSSEEQQMSSRGSYKKQEVKTDTSSGGMGIPVIPKTFQSPKPVLIPVAPATPVIATSSATPSPLSPLPDGWSEHKTQDGRTYFYNSFTNQSHWTAPTSATPTANGQDEPVSPAHQVVNSPKRTGSSPRERVAPRGWTKEINPFTQTPIYTNCRSGEKWALAHDDRGYHYYNTADTSLTVKDLPAIVDEPSPTRSQSDDVSVGVYDHLAPVINNQKRSRVMSEDEGTKEHSLNEPRGSLPVSATASLPQYDMWSSRLSTVLKKHGYLQKKRLLDSNGKKVKGDKWVKVYVVLQDNQLFFYNDHKTKDHPGAKPLSVFNLLQATISSTNVKDKKKNVILVNSISGEQFYLQADTPSMMNDWYSTLQSAIDQTNEDFKKNPDKYADYISQLEANDKPSDSPPSQPRFFNRKPSATTKDDDDAEDLEGLTGEERTVRIKGRLRNLIARRPQMETLKKSGIIQDSVFGCELSRLAEREKRFVPQFFQHFMEHIEKRGLEVVGLYRLSGNAAQVQKLRYLVEDNPLVDLSGSEWTDINIVTGCLKLYLRELPDPLIPFKHFRSFIDAARTNPSEKRVLAIAAEMDRLPDPNYYTLKALILHLKKVCEYGHINKMLPSNVGIVFGPTVMRAELDSIEMATLMPVQNGLVETFILDSDKIFRK